MSYKLIVIIPTIKIGSNINILILIYKNKEMDDRIEVKIIITIIINFEKKKA